MPETAKNALEEWVIGKQWKDTKFVQQLRDRGFEGPDLQDIVEIVTGTCHECWDDDRKCQCWNDE